jgi:hypothetical protein
VSLGAIGVESRHPEQLGFGDQRVEEPGPTEPRLAFDDQRAASASVGSKQPPSEPSDDSVAPDESRRDEIGQRDRRALVLRQPGNRREALEDFGGGRWPRERVQAQQRADQRVERGRDPGYERPR